MTSPPPAAGAFASVLAGGAHEEELEAVLVPADDLLSAAAHSRVAQSRSARARSVDRELSAGNGQDNAQRRGSVGARVTQTIPTRAVLTHRFDSGTASSSRT
jgi:hypothetical protein